MSEMDVLIKSLGVNGPWALVAGWLLLTVIKAWEKDRQQTLEVLGQWQADRLKSAEMMASTLEVNREMVGALTGLRQAVESLTAQHDIGGGR